MKRQTGGLRTLLAVVLVDSGQYAEARKEYEAGLRICEEVGDLRTRGVILGQLGTLAMWEGKLEEAKGRHRAALALFQQLREPAMEAVAWYQLGSVFQEAQQWDEAERHYRESARIEEERDNLAGAAQAWNCLAIVSKAAGKPEAAEGWYRKAIEGGRAQGDLLPMSQALGNLANLLQTQPDRLPEARQFAEEALAIHKTLDPAAAEIWKTYGLLAEIADKEAAVTADSRRQAELQAEARNHRRLAREAWRNFPGSRQALKKHLPLIVATLMAVQDSARREHLDAILKALSDRGWNKLVNAIHRIVVVGRDPEALCADLRYDDCMIIETILAALSDPSTLSDLLPPGHGSDSDVSAIETAMMGDLVSGDQVTIAVTSAWPAQAPTLPLRYRS